MIKRTINFFNKLLFVFMVFCYMCLGTAIYWAVENKSPPIEVLSFDIKPVVAKNNAVITLYRKIIYHRSCMATTMGVLVDEAGWESFVFVSDGGFKETEKPQMRTREFMIPNSVPANTYTFYTKTWFYCNPMDYMFEQYMESPRRTITIKSQ